MPKIPEWHTGVYGWRNLIDGKRYVGSGASKGGIKTRKQAYLRDLPRGKCHNRYLQRAWDKHGAEAFVFEVLEYCPPEECLEREQFWIDRFKTAEVVHGYNLCPTAGNSLGFKHTLETRRQLKFMPKGLIARLRMSASGKKKKLTAEHKAKIRLAGIGRVKSDATLAKLSASLKGKKRSGQALANIRAANAKKRKKDV